MVKIRGMGKTILGLSAVLFAASTAGADTPDLDDAQHDISTTAADLHSLRQWAGNRTERTVAACHKRVAELRAGGVKTLKGMWYENGKKLEGSSSYEITLAQADELCDDFGRWLVVHDQYRTINFAYDQL